MLGKYDYIIDACDSVMTKVELIKYAHDNDITIISSMGMGNRLDPTKVVISKLLSPSTDPLTKKVRMCLRKKYGEMDCSVVTSLEPAKKGKGKVSSMMMVPSAAGLAIVYYIINDIIKK